MREKNKKRVFFSIFSGIIITGFVLSILLYHENTKFTRYEGNISISHDNYDYEITEVSQYKNGYTIKGWGRPKDAEFHKFAKKVILLDEKENKKYMIPTSYDRNPEEENVKELPLDTAMFHATALNKYLKDDRKYRVLLLDENLLIDTKVIFTKNGKGTEHEN